MYKIMFEYPGQEPEEIDEADTQEDADYLLGEYRLAYGPGSKLWIKKVK